MISVVLATHNEEKNLAKCLKAVAGFADEIIIADGESTDKTVEIAKEFKAKLIKTTNKPNFHINKQMAMDAAKGELVLQMDADEIVDKELQSFIKKTHEKILSGEEVESAWWIRRRNYFLGRFLKKGGQYPDPVIRLYQRGKAKLPQKDVHEQMVVDGEVGWADGHLEHYGNPTFAVYLQKWNAYTSLKATQLKEEGVRIGLINGVKYMLIKPVTTFFSLFVRHKGFVDGFSGYVFAQFSALYWPVSYLKLWELSRKGK